MCLQDSWISQRLLGDHRRNGTAPRGKNGRHCGKISESVRERQEQRLARWRTAGTTNSEVLQRDSPVAIKLPGPSLVDCPSTERDSP